MIQRISQSFIKSFRAYLQEQECGIILREKFVNDKLFDDPEGAKNLGAYMEYHTTGALPKNGQIPQPEMMASGKDMTVKYRIALKNAIRLRGNPELKIPGMIREMGLKIISVQPKCDHGRFTGYPDTIVMVVENRRFVQQTDDPQNPIIIRWRKGDKFWLDLKSSGLLDDRWSKYGWAWSPIQKDFHGIQAKQYTLITGLPGYFLVVQSNNSESEMSDVRLFHVPVTKEDIEQHVSMANDYWEQFQVMVKADLFKPYPEMKRCFKCPLKKDCKWRRDFPHPQTINL